MPVFSSIPGDLDGARVLFFAKTDGQAFVEFEDQRWPIVAVAIAKYADENAYYLFSLNNKNEVIGDTYWHSIADAKDTACEVYGVNDSDWIEL